MPDGWYGLICCLCFEGLTSEECYVDSEGQKWDACVPCGEKEGW